MSSEQQETPEASADADSIEDIIERGLGRMREQSKTNTTHLAAMAEYARETQQTVQALAEMLTPCQAGAALEPPAGSSADGAIGNRTATQGETRSPASGPGDRPAADEGIAGGPQDASEPGADDAEEAEDSVTTADPKDEGGAAPAEEENQVAITPAGGDDTGVSAEDARTEAAPPAHPTPAPSKREKKMFRLLAKIEKHLATSPRQTEILETLAAIRSGQEAQNEAIAAAFALTPATPGDDPRMPPAWQAFQEVMTRLDRIVGIIRPAPGKPTEVLDQVADGSPPPGETEPPALPPPDPVLDADEVRHAVDTLAEAAARTRRGFSRFAWISILVVTLSAGALGGILQQQYTLLDLPDDTLGWKDRVWEFAGEEIARCIVASADRGSRCAVTVEAGGAAPASDP